MLLSTKTQLFCSIADPGSDLTGALYNEMIEALKIDALYLPTQCIAAEAGFDGVKALGFEGFSVSMPHKQTIMAHLDEIDTTARQIGAVNTVTHSGGRWRGYNTDWYGAVEALRNKTEIEGKKVLLLGAGGAARAIAYGITHAGGKLHISNRTEAKAEALAKEFAGEFLRYDQLGDAPPFDIIINATSIGFMANEAVDHPLPLEQFHPGQVVFDIVFLPIDTPLLKDAASRGALTVPGYKMFIHQAIMQIKLWLDAELEDYGPVEQTIKRFIQQGAF